MTKVEQVADLMVELYERLSAWELAVVKDSALTLPQMHTLEILGAVPSLRMKELAAKMGISTGTLTVNVDRLEKLGLVNRMPHATDRRSILVSLTAAGQNFYTEHHHHHLCLTQDFLSTLTPQEAQCLVPMVTKLIQVLQQQSLGQE